MITTAADYKYTDVAGVDVTGDILPAVDGTPSSAVIRHENIVYLVEMARERYWWMRQYYNGYDDPVERVRDFCLRDFTVTGTQNPRRYQGDNGGGGVADILAVAAEYATLVNPPSLFALSGSTGDFIPAGWNAADAGIVYPVVPRDPDTGAPVYDLNPESEIEETMEAAAASSPPGERPLSGDDLRRAFYDFQRVRRFIVSIRWGEGLTFAQWAEDHADAGGYRTCMASGPYCVNDGRTTRRIERPNGSVEDQTYSGAYLPSMWQEWTLAHELEYTGAIFADGWLFLIHNGYYNNGRTSTPYLPEYLDGWLRLFVFWDIYDGQTHSEGRLRVVVEARFRRYGSPEGTALAGYGEMFYQLVSVESGQPMLGTYRRMLSWCAENVPGFDADKLVSFRVEVGNGGVAMETGPIELNTDLTAANWQWAPGVVPAGAGG